MLEEWGLPESGIVCLTSDSGSNMVKAADLAGWPRVSCFGHNLHNAIHAGLGRDAKIARAIGACRSVSFLVIRSVSFLLIRKNCFL